MRIEISKENRLEGDILGRRTTKVYESPDIDDEIRQTVVGVRLHRLKLNDVYLDSPKDFAELIAFLMDAQDALAKDYSEKDVKQEGWETAQAVTSGYLNVPSTLTIYP